jgi:hypothetical protein
MEKSMLDTSSSSGLCGLVLWVTVWNVHMFCHKVYRNFLLNALSRLLEHVLWLSDHSL